VDGGADVNARDNEGNPAIQGVVKPDNLRQERVHLNPTLLRDLIRLGANINARNDVDEMSSDLFIKQRRTLSDDAQELREKYNQVIEFFRGHGAIYKTDGEIAIHTEDNEN
jgi:hypothetical protein